MNEGKLVKVVFDLHPDEHGWPPVGSESLWAERLSETVARLDNVPFFVRGFSCGDLVEVALDNGELWVQQKLRSSGNYTIRVIAFADGPLGGDNARVLEAFRALEVEGEGAEQFGLAALNIPPHADYPAIRRLLTEGVRDGSWDYEEGCIGDAWITVDPEGHP
jgi:Domain of unknown function (DUF4265)